MDGVEIVVEVEEAFGVALDDRACAQVVTVGDLCELVLSQVSRAEQMRCLTALAFWRLRRALMAMNVERAAVRPDVPLERLLGLSSARRARREAWTQLESTLGLTLPPLVRSRVVVATCWAISGVVLVAGLALAAGGTQRWLVVGAVLALGALLAALTRPARVHVPACARTAGVLSRWLVLRHAGALAAAAGGFTRAQVRGIVRRLVARHQGLPLERVELEARFVDDLGVD